MKDSNIELLDARNEIDIQRAKNPLIFINGGHGHRDLLNGVKNNKKILNLILNTEYIVVESAGSMLMGQFQRGNNKIAEGLGILEDTIIEPHYSEKSRQQLLMDEMKQVNAKYGIGIDCVTAIIVDPREFPSKWVKVGSGIIDVRTSQ